jgi:phosphatidylinositol alpha-1,6-mannosyltransferase
VTALPRILLLAASRGLGGGIEVYVGALSEQLAALGVDLESVTMLDAGHGFAPTPVTKAAFTIRVLERAYRLRHRTGPVEVWCMLPSFAPLAVTAARIAGNGATTRVFFYGDDAWGARRRPFNRRFAPVTISPFTAGAVSEAGAAAILPPGIPADLYDELRAAPARPFPPPGRPVRILSVFRLGAAKAKGAFVLIEAAERLRAEGRDIHLVLAGVGPPPADLVDAVASRAAWVSVAADPDPAALALLYRSCDLFVLATRFSPRRPASGEGFGIVLVEAALAGRPVVGPAHDGSSAAMLPGITGFRPSDESVDALTATIRWSVTNADRMTAAGLNARVWSSAAFDPAGFRRAVEQLVTGAPGPLPDDLGLDLRATVPSRAKSAHG